MGIDGYYRRFIKRFSKTFHYITSLKRKSKNFIWSTKCETNFQWLKHLLTNANVLRILDPGKYLLVCNDACK
jgi:hypothetical protein